MPIKTSCRFCKAEFSHEAFDERTICLDCQGVVLDIIAACNLGMSVEPEEKESEFFDVALEEKYDEPPLAKEEIQAMIEETCKREIDAYRATIIKQTEDTIECIEDCTLEKIEDFQSWVPEEVVVPKKKRGRPKGSTNKKKENKKGKKKDKS